MLYAEPRSIAGAGVPGAGVRKRWRLLCPRFQCRGRWCWRRHLRWLRRQALPPRRRDLVAGYILTFYAFSFVYIAGNIVTMAYQNYGEGKFQALSSLRY